MMLSIDTNAKTIKGQQYGYLTGVLYLAPYDLSGYQVCAMAYIAQCHEGCLNSAGRGAFNSVQAARVRKTRLFFEDRAAFFAELIPSIRLLIRKAANAGELRDDGWHARPLIPVCRLNGTSDIKWEVVDFWFEGKHYNNIFEMFPDLQFYDYTKIANRNVDHIPNYDLTFSYSGVPAFQPYVQRAARDGYRIAVVFRNREDIPAEFLGTTCVDGDDSDLRHEDPPGVVVALYAKGKAKRDTSGFVVDV
jgi:hypothetical protein